MRKLGILGGFGPQATTDFAVRLHRAAQAIVPQHNNAGYPPLLAYYHRRAPIVVRDDGSPVLPLQPDPELLAMARLLGRWADLLVIISNGAHAIQAEIEQAADRPVVSMIDATLAELRRRQVRRVGVLGLFGPRIYQEPLAALGIACDTVDAELQARLDQAIFAVMEGRAAEVQAVGQEAVAALRARGVDAIVLGCTEIPFLVPELEHDPAILNPTQLLAEAAVRAAVSEEIALASVREI